MSRYLPSATKLRRLCFYRCVCVHGGGGVVSQHALQVVSQHALLQVSRRGVVSQHALQVVSQHALQQVSRGVPALGGRCLLPGGGACSQGCVEETLPASRRLLLRRVCILLECTLLFDKYTQEMRN